MIRLPAIVFAATIAIWGLASIPDEGSSYKASHAFRRVDLATTPEGAFLPPMQKRQAFAFRDARSHATLALR
jgi:hypothetical protein